MTTPALRKRAEELYVACPTVKPNWDQLGGTTQAVWIERAKAPNIKTATPTKSKFAKYLK